MSRAPQNQPGMFAAAPLRGCTCPICMAARMKQKLAASPLHGNTT